MSKELSNPAPVSPSQGGPAAIVMIILGAALRLVPHPANVAPIAALALFGGAYLPLRYGVLIPLLAMAASDLVIGFDVASAPYVYGMFALTALLGRWVGARPKLMRLVGGSLLASIGFYLVTNLVWIYPASLYPQTLAGQLESYVMALPFFRNTLVGDLLFSGVFFGAYALAEAWARRPLAPKFAQRLFSLT